MTIEEGLEQMGYEIRHVSPNWRLKEEEMPITQEDREREYEHNRRLMVAEADADRKHRSRLQAIKDVYDLYGEDAIVDPEDKILLIKHYDFFLEG